MKRTLHILFIFIWANIYSQAQIPEDVQPPSWNSQIASETSIKAFKLPVIDLKALRDEDAINDNDKSKPWRFGVEKYVDHDITEKGKWTTLENGDRIWKMSYSSEGALTLNFVFDRFKLPIGAKLYVYSDDKTDLLRPFTHHNNNAEEVLGTWTVNGSKAWLEYYEPANATGDLKLTLGSVVHGYRTADSFQKALGDSGNCNHDVDCDITPAGADPFGVDTLKENVKASAGMLLTGNTSFCSGSLVNNTNNDGTPYFLTANHCGGGEGTWAFRFNWRSPNPSCGTTAPSPNGSFDQTVSGAILRANSSQSDMELVEITDPTFFINNTNLVWAGWNRSTTATPSLNFGIHHPSGDIQKVCRDDQGATRISTAFNGNPNADMWRIADWDLGVTEGGSSGSPLFNESGKVIGMLSGGSAACSGTNDNGGFDIYGRFGVGWDFGGSASSRLRDWLDPAGTDPIEIDQFPPTQTFNYDARVTLGTSVSPEICNEDFAPSITVINSGQITLTSATITYSLDGSPVTTINWTGSLATNESAVETIAPYTNLSSGDHTFVVSISNPNGNTDENTSNDVFTYNFLVSPDFSTATIIFNLTTDEFGQETDWQLVNSSGTVVDSGPASDYDDEVTIQEIITIPTFNECYTFTITDTYGDGICCAYGFGSYNLQDDSGNIIIDSTGEFGSAESVTFEVNDPLSVDEAGLDNLLTIYPNPTSDVLYIKLANVQDAKFSVSNLLGQSITSGALNANDVNTLDLSESASGVYFITINSGNSTLTKKIVKQ
ncbi:T9SS type A sorting domain-containing protein [Psychroserpens algicola]|uniref:T9SS type A sorting domain-containing protein n=1 Tax=Psychroserpens algicola TaxID=1719034 RepID=UPI001952FA85|nr:T9SS type A sorting domain-containing protein [Psychroserpens algicola]